ncbi:MAG: orotidine-5'-phosphate decarboxylase [Opitutales bacterium]|nr:orotidine-5'-phosphate decarboxylase [Opitutales bacterium]MCH8540214.1 orotidine-5'-phosphate decarboxylase [Opitutales bacterium]
MKTELILALDVEDRETALRTLEPLQGDLPWVKIGLQLFTRYGPSLVEEIADKGFQVFLDLKLHDIPNTVAKAVASLARLPIGMLTLHTSGGFEMMQAAAKEAGEKATGLKLLGVTVLTSMDAPGLLEVGVEDKPEAQVLRLARLAREAGLPGLVSSPLELPLLRQELGQDMILVTPGIRPSSAALDEQKRVATPSSAARDGASYIVVGRPILRADDPVAAVRSIQAELFG